MEDVLSDIFRRIELKSCVYFKRDFWSPWAMEINNPGMAQFHVLIRGRCVLEADGIPYHGAPGDVFLLPQGGGHILADQAGRDPVTGQIAMESFQSESPMFSDGDLSSQLICGHYVYRNELEHPLLEQLPSVIHIRSFETAAPGIINTILPMIACELNDQRPGTDSVVERLAEVLLVQVLRTHLEEQKHPRGFLAGLSDTRLMKAIRMMHGDTGRPLGLEELATAAGMSRSAFALHFKTVTGFSPHAYLTQWRMFQACELLRVNRLPLVEVAGRVGYESEISFSRAFKKILDVTPAEYRRAAP